jgi:hypothetical protein
MRTGAPETQQRKRYKLPVRKQVLQASSIGASASTKSANTIQTCSLETGVGGFSEHASSSLEFVGARVLILEIRIVFSWGFQNTCSQATCFHRLPKTPQKKRYENRCSGNPTA